MSKYGLATTIVFILMLLGPSSAAAIEAQNGTRFGQTGSQIPGFLFAFGPVLPLFTVWDRTSPPPLPVLIVVAVCTAVVAPILIFSAFSWALFYRCPQCKQRIKRLSRDPLPDRTGFSLRYTCYNCKIEWDILWHEGGDGL